MTGTRTLFGEYLEKRRDILEDAINEIKKELKKDPKKFYPEEFELILRQSPVVPPGTSKEFAERIHDLLIKMKLDPAESGLLREYFHVHKNIEDALKAIERIKDKRQLMATLQKESVKRAGRKEGVKELAERETKDKYVHAINEHGG